MKPLLELFWQVCWLRKGPQDVPYSPPLLVILVVVLLAFSALLIAVFDPAYLGAKLLGSLLGLALWFVIVYSLLSIKKHGERFVQTMVACLGTDLLISMLGLPLQFAIMSGLPTGFISSVVRGSILALMIWDIVIKGWIYGEAMGLGRLGGNVLAIALWIIIMLVSFSFLPPEALQQPQQ